jgi:hypothetical protein
MRPSTLRWMPPVARDHLGDLKRRRVEDATECQKRLRSEAFRSLVKDTGIATYGCAILKEYPSQKAAFRAASREFESARLHSSYDVEDGEIVEESFTPDHTPPSPRAV